MTTRFTPGPWRVYSEYGSIGSITNADGSVVVAQAQQVEPRSHETRLANTHLIASAPELLEVLQRLLELPVAKQELRFLDAGIGTLTPSAAWLEARAALAKARGSQ